MKYDIISERPTWLTSEGIFGEYLRTMFFDPESRGSHLLPDRPHLGPICNSDFSLFALR